MTELTALPALPAGSLSVALTLAVVPGVGGAADTPYRAPLPAAPGLATTTTTGLVKGGGNVTIGSDGTLNGPAGGVSDFEVMAGVSGVVGTLPGGAGATVLRRLVAHPFSTSAGLAMPYPARATVGTAPTASATFTLEKQAGGVGAAVQFGAAAVAVSGAVTFAATATTFAAGDVLVISAPTPADATLADVILVITATRS